MIDFETKLLLAELQKLASRIDPDADLSEGRLSFRVIQQEHLRLKAEVAALRKRAELLDFMRDFEAVPRPVASGGKIRYIVASMNLLIADFANKHGSWDSPEAALAACRDWVISPEGTGWANRPKGGEA